MYIKLIKSFILILCFLFLFTVVCNLLNGTDGDILISVPPICVMLYIPFVFYKVWQNE